MKNIFKIYLIFQNSAFLYISFLFSTFLEIFPPLTLAAEGHYFISDETCGQVDSLLSVSQNVEILNPKNVK